MFVPSIKVHKTLIVVCSIYGQECFDKNDDVISMNIVSNIYKTGKWYSINETNQ